MQSDKQMRALRGVVPYGARSTSKKSFKHFAERKNLRIMIFLQNLKNHNLFK
jgi:hypothetical protein